MVLISPLEAFVFWPQIRSPARRQFAYRRFRRRRGEWLILSPAFDYYAAFILLKVSYPCYLSRDR